MDKNYYRTYIWPTINVWYVCNGLESKMFINIAEACSFLGIGKTTFRRHYNSGKPIKSGWTIDKGVIKNEI